jgi:hypothetical protein
LSGHEKANNGGPTKMHALLAGSPAIDHGNNPGVAAVDQRGLPRVKDGNGDGSRSSTSEPSSGNRQFGGLGMSGPGS